MTGPARSIARFASTLRYEDIPAAVRERARDAILSVDTLRVRESMEALRLA